MEQRTSVQDFERIFHWFLLETGTNGSGPESTGGYLGSYFNGRTAGRISDIGGRLHTRPRASYYLYFFESHRSLSLSLSVELQQYHQVIE